MNLQIFNKCFLDNLKESNYNWINFDHSYGLPINLYNSKRYRLPLSLNMLILEKEKKYNSKFWAEDVQIGLSYFKEDAFFFEENGIKYYNIKEFKRCPNITQKEKINYNTANFLVKKNEIEIKDSKYACYFYSNKTEEQNIICCPNKDFFVDETEYFATLFHEMMHWANFKLNEKDENYLLGEFIAEFGSNLLLIYCNLPISNMDYFDIYKQKWYDLFSNNEEFLNQCWIKIDNCLDLIIK